MKLKEFFIPYCSLIDNVITIVGRNEKNLLTFEASNLTNGKTGVYDKDTSKVVKIPDDILNAEIITWGTYNSNNKTILKIYIRYEVE